MFLFLPKTEACLLLKMLAKSDRYQRNAPSLLCLLGDERRGMAERYLITISAQSKSNRVPPQGLSVVCYFERSCTAPVLPSLKPERRRAGQRKLAGALGKSTRGHSWSDTIHWEEVTVRRNRCFRRTFHFLRTKAMGASGNRFFSPAHFRSFWSHRSRNTGL